MIDIAFWFQLGLLILVSMSFFLMILVSIIMVEYEGFKKRKQKRK